MGPGSQRNIDPAREVESWSERENDSSRRGLHGRRGRDAYAIMPFRVTEKTYDVVSSKYV